MKKTIFKIKKFVAGITRVISIIAAVIGSIGTIAWSGLLVYVIATETHNWQFNLPLDDRIFLVQLESVPISLLVFGMIAFELADRKLKKLVA
jgi:hypothetical protein